MWEGEAPAEPGPAIVGVGGRSFHGAGTSRGYFVVAARTSRFGTRSQTALRSLVGNDLANVLFDSGKDVEVARVW